MDTSRENATSGLMPVSGFKVRWTEPNFESIARGLTIPARLMECQQTNYSSGLADYRQYVAWLGGAEDRQTGIVQTGRAQMTGKTVGALLEFAMKGWCFWVWGLMCGYAFREAGWPGLAIGIGLGFAAASFAGAIAAFMLFVSWLQS